MRGAGSRDRQQEGMSHVLETSESRRDCLQVELFVLIMLSRAGEPLTAVLSQLAANLDRQRASILDHT